MMPKTRTLKKIVASVEELSDYIKRVSNLVVVTGAGVSKASNLPVYRNTPDAVWSKNVLRCATKSFFIEDPVSSWLWHIQNFECFFDAKPNPSHEALHRIEEKFLQMERKFLIITQNVDLLHETAGSKNLVKVHGSIDKIRCSYDDVCEYAAPRGLAERTSEEEQVRAFLEDPSESRLPRCSSCSSFLRPHVLWFDEGYDFHRQFQIERINREVKHADCILFVGTSHSVHISDVILRIALRKNAKIVNVDPFGTVPHPSVISVIGKSEDILPEIERNL